MMETLAVIVFCATIFTFLYVSVLPLIGTYNDLIIRESNIDIVYKLYNIRLAVQKDNKLKETLEPLDFKKIECSDFKVIKDGDEDIEYCNNLMTQMELTNYDLFYTKSIKNNLNGFSSNEVLYDYLKNYKDDDRPVLILIDNDKKTVAHLDYYELNKSTTDPDVLEDEISNDLTKTGRIPQLLLNKRKSYGRSIFGHKVTA